MGYVVAYAVSGVSADAIGKITGQGVGKGSAVVIQIAGIMLALIALSILPMKSVRALEENGERKQS
jgi:sulfite exporter TauE/SafE